MSDSAIRVENLGKCYLVGHSNANSERYTALRDVMAQNIHNLVRKTKDMIAGKPIIQGDSVEEFWALKDVSFEVKCGERVGIIGRNGAGKSTLLKVLSRITEPTRGCIHLNGRLASLLEVGTGFHPELTGRENIYLNGAILGMGRKEISRKFDEIVDFAEVEKFLDTPVKRYSSGMYVRLAFAVAAHLEPEILVVDEVLAVGDIAFQKKCLGKMEDVGKEGRTVLFVSHNMAAVSQLCDKGIYLSNGCVEEVGEIEGVIGHYLRSNDKCSEENLLIRIDRKGNGLARIASVGYLDSECRKINAAVCGQQLYIEIKLVKGKGNVDKALRNVRVSIGIDSSNGQRVWHLSSETTDDDLGCIEFQHSTIRVLIPRVPLTPGVYYLTLHLTSNDEIVDWIQNAAVMNVEAGDFFNTGKLPPSGQGVLLADYSFSIG